MGKLQSSKLVSGQGLLMERIVKIACHEQAGLQSMKFLVCVHSSYPEYFLKVKKVSGFRDVFQNGVLQLQQIEKLFQAREILPILGKKGANISHQELNPDTDYSFIRVCKVTLKRPKHPFMVKTINKLNRPELPHTDDGYL